MLSLAIFHWHSLTMTLKVLSMAFVVGNTFCILLRRRVSQLAGFGLLLLWNDVVISYSVIWYFNSLSMGLRVFVIGYLLMESVFLIVNVVILPIIFKVHYVMPYIGDIRDLPFNTKFSSSEKMKTELETVRRICFGSLDEVRTVCDESNADLFGKDINQIIADYLWCTLPQFDGDSQEDIDRKLGALIVAGTWFEGEEDDGDKHRNSCSMTPSSLGGEMQKLTHLTVRVVS